MHALVLLRIDQYTTFEVLA